MTDTEDITREIDRAEQEFEACGCPVAADHGSAFRNLFGPAKSEDLYAEGKPDDATNALLRRLAFSMKRNTPQEESAMPAGYTYLAQFATHDLVFNPTRVPNLFDGLTVRQDQRHQRLMLETLYGGGPGVCPHLFRRQDQFSNKERSAMRLLFVFDDVKLESMRADLPESLGAYRDLPRVAFDDGSARGEQLTTLADVLLADPRNDDHLILAQMTTLFILLHNLFVGHLMDVRRRATSRDIFLLASKATTLIYRRILFEDLMPRLVHPEVLKAYMNDTNPWRLEQTTSSKMNREFSHAVFRAGHSLVRPRYKLNWEPIDGQEDTTIEEIIDRRSATEPKGNLPHRDKWLIQWSNFFEISNDVTPQRAAKITPEITKPFADHKVFKSDSDGVGLGYIDLLRGAHSGVRSVDSLVRLMAVAKAPLAEKMARCTWESEMKQWLTDMVDLGKENGLEVSDIDPLLKDPPLMFFVMYEASKEGGDYLFGPLASVVIAETFFSCRDRTLENIERDNRSTELVEEYFDSIGENVPEEMDMPWLIRFLATRYKYGDKGKRFI